ncbi:hypothetical protein GRX03_15405 [Halovenus sp. WSH3]|uniref:Membrane-bound metal-dependent hydrolase n=1 Tax=Halovenus carboxidivorans TaxID=2692199 RepID=A0A6B0T4E7_9EURY|nr:metal-dependent hydrolase [Halovenus carboxidivorans]MXR52985.1 hypothetical protein [Halovenus carboxidivorans]
MDPIKHVILALLPVVCYTVLRERTLPSGPIMLIAVAGGLAADVIDKPLAWQFGVVPSGRMVAHSLVLSVPVLVAVVVLAARLDQLFAGLVFAWGHLSHIATDFRSVLFHGTDSYWFPNLFWPLLPANPDRTVGYGDNLPMFDAVFLLEVALLVVIFGYIAVDIGATIRERRQPG